MSDLDKDIAYEALVTNSINNMIDDYAEEIAYCWRFGDGCGGSLIEKIVSRVNAQGYSIKLSQPSTQTPLKQKISGSLAKKVFERDVYRCKCCETHLDLTVDHIHPESKGGDLSMDNLQTLCRSCNSKKGVAVE